MLITNANLITFEQPNQIINDQAILIEAGKINKIGNSAEMISQFHQEESINARNRFVLPGNICAHTHFYGAFARGLAIPGDAPANFSEILEKLWWKLDKSLTREDIYCSTLVCLIDAIKHGTTTLIDHHASPAAISGSLDAIAQGVQEAGVRASLCYEVTDRDGEKLTEEGIKENIRFIDQVKRNKQFGGLIASSFGLHASLTLSDKTLENCRNMIPDGFGFHIHAAEDVADQYDSMKKSGIRVIERLSKFNILGPKTIVAHAVHIDAKEIDLLKDTATWVTHQPRSNMNNAVGVAEVESMLNAGVKVGIGNDGFSNAMWDEWRAAYLIHKLWHLDPRRMGADKIIHMAVHNNSQLVKTLFENIEVGVIKPGAQADLIVVDYLPFTEMTPGNVPWHIIFGFRDSMVRTTIVNGKVLMLEGELKTLDEDKISHQAKKLSAEVWRKFSDQF